MAYILGADTRSACGSFVYTLRECVCKKGVRGVHSRSRYTHRLWKFRVHPAGVCVRRVYAAYILAANTHTACGSFVYTLREFVCKKGVRGVHSRSRYRTACGSFVYTLREFVCKKGVRGVHSRSRYTHRLWKFRVHPEGMCVLEGGTRRTFSQQIPHRLWKFRVHPEGMCVLEGGTRRTFSQQIHAALVEVSCTPCGSACVRRVYAAYTLGADTRTACGSFVYTLRECVCKKGVRGVHSRSRYTQRLWKFRVHPAGVCV